MNSEKQKPERSPRKTSKVRIIVGGAAVAAVAGVGGYVAANHQSTQEKEALRAEAEALSTLEAKKGEVIDSVFVFNEGVNVRREPIRKSKETTDEGHIDITNEELSVGRDEHLVVNRPFVVRHDDGDIYLGFTLSDRDVEKDPEDNVYYVALSAIQDQQRETGQELLTEYPMANDGVTGYSYDIKTGQLHAADNHDIATAKIMNNEDTTFLVDALPPYQPEA